MIDEEKEYRNAFYFSKRWAKSPLTPSYTRGYSRGNADKEPAKKTHDYILSLDEDSTTNFEEKINLLYSFLQNAEEERKKQIMGTDFYSNIMTYIRISKKQIANGKLVKKRRK